MSNRTTTTRRQMLKGIGLAGLALSAGDVLGLPIFGPVTLPQRGEVKPVKAGANHPLVRGAVQAAAVALLGRRQIKLRLDTSTAHTVTQSFDLSAAQARSLRQQRVTIDSAAVGISDPASIRALRARMTELKMPEVTINRTLFFFIRAGRRDPRSATSAAYASELSYVLGLSERAGQYVISLLQVDRVLRIGGTLIGNFLPSKPGGSTGDQPPPVVTPYPEEGENTQDFATCFGGCVKDTPEWLVGLVLAVCGGCGFFFTAAATTGFAEPGSDIAAFISCTGCIAGIAAPLAMCFFQCQEML